MTKPAHTATSQSSSLTAAALRSRAWLSDFAALTKLRLTSTVVLSAALAYGIAATQFDWTVFAAVILGGFATTMAANVLNQVLEREHDRHMHRTENRPLAAGRQTVATAVLTAGLLSIVGTLSLASINATAALLGMVALLSYAFVYTPLKRFSVAAVFVGTIPGALPALIGTVAAEGSITDLGMSLFAIQVLWQIPHFWAIGWLGFDDYQRAGFKLLPVTENGERDPGTGLQSMVIGLVLAALVWWPFAVGAFSIVAASLGCLLGIGYAVFGYRLWMGRDRRNALQLMFYSLAYLPLVFGLGWCL